VVNDPENFAWLARQGLPSRDATISMPFLFLIYFPVVNEPIESGSAFAGHAAQAGSSMQFAGLPCILSPSSSGSP
jgi:hypothetical protein